MRASLRNEARRLGGQHGRLGYSDCPWRQGTPQTAAYRRANRKAYLDSDPMSIAIGKAMDHRMHAIDMQFDFMPATSRTMTLVITDGDDRLVDGDDRLTGAALAALLATMGCVTAPPPP